MNIVITEAINKLQYFIDHLATIENDRDYLNAVIVLLKSGLAREITYPFLSAVSDNSIVSMAQMNYEKEKENIKT